MEQEFKLVCTASKGSYGLGFGGVYDNLDELKKAIVKHYLNPFDDEDDKYTEKDYTEELFKDVCKKGQYQVVIINLHESEEIEFDEYDGTSSPYVQKIDPQLKSEIHYVTDKEWEILNSEE